MSLPGKRRGSGEGLQRFGSLLMVIFAGLCLVAGVGDEAYSEYQEYELKAAFLYNFAKFVEWPAESFTDQQDYVLVCVLGNDPFGNLLDTLTAKTVGGRRLAVRRITRVEEAGRCHILFISASERHNLPQDLKALRGANILTVGDTRGFAESGVIINMTTSDNKVGFEINLTAAERTSLKISSKLLKLGKVVREGR